MDEVVTTAVPLRDKLLGAAEKVIARDGVKNLTLEGVAREAGVSKGGLLYHFPSKKELIVAIVDRLGCRCAFEQERAEAGSDGSPGAFSRAYLNARTRPLDPQEEPIHSALLAAAATDPEYLAPIRARVGEWQKRLENDGIDPAVATIIRLAVDGMCLGKMFNMPVPEGELRTRVLDLLTELSRGTTKAGK
jgi:AcrR family transcriptional regulator